MSNKSFLEKIRQMSRKKLVGNFLLLVILIYSIVFISVFFSLSISLFKTIGSINIPDKYLSISLVSENPSLNASYSISNKGFSDTSNLVIDFKVDLYYFELYNENGTRENLFFKTEKVKKVNPWQHYESVIKGDADYFNKPNLFYFWNNVNLSKPFSYILDINITGKYCLGFIPFKIIINDLSPM